LACVVLKHSEGRLSKPAALNLLGSEVAKVEPPLRLLIRIQKLID
jgi:hypothetical protein